MSLNKIQKFLIIKIYTCVSSIRDHLYLRYPGNDKLFLFNASFLFMDLNENNSVNFC